MESVAQNDIAQIIFQKLDDVLIKKLLPLKPQIQGNFVQDKIIDIQDLKQQNLNIQNGPSVILQIRDNYILQIIKKQHKKGNKTFFIDEIISGLQLNPKIHFQTKRQYQYEFQPLPKPIGIILYLNKKKRQDQSIDFISQDPTTNIQKFAKILQSKFLVQKNFHKIFKPIRKLGKGASSTVIQGIDIRNQIHYAVKGFKKSKGYSLEKGIFYKEFDIIKKLVHPNLPKLHSIFQTKHTLYMILDKFDENLYDFLIDKGLSSEYELKSIMKGILQILEFLHNQNIMHRDIKPQNIMIKRQICQKQQLLKRKTNIQPILIDFGFAQYQTNQQYTLYRCGTPGFIAPQILKDYLISEQIKDSFNSQISVSKKKYTKSCDIFSLGCLFHILLTGKMLFEGKTRNQLIHQNIQAKINLNNNQYKFLDISAKKLLFRMLQKDQYKRINATQALKDDFFKLQMFNFKPIKFKNHLSLEKSVQNQNQQEGDKQLFLFQ